MIKFNINDYIYVQITKEGWKHLEKEVSKEYIKHCIYPYKKEIKGKVWYKLQMHQVFDVLHENCAQHHIHTNILIDIKPKERKKKKLLSERLGMSIEVICVLVIIFGFLFLRLIFFPLIMLLIQ